MGSIVLIGLVLILASGAVHYVAMTVLQARIAGISVNRAAKAQLALLGLSAAHLLEAGFESLNDLLLNSCSAAMLYLIATERSHPRCARDPVNRSGAPSIRNTPSQFVGVPESSNRCLIVFDQVPGKIHLVLLR